MLLRVAEKLDDVDEIDCGPAPARKPACRHLPAVFSSTQDGHLVALIHSFRELEPFLHWTQNPNYSDELLGAGYMNNYAYCDVVGSQGLIDCNDLVIGFLLLGPHRLYSDYHHAASEVYHVISGNAAWRQGSAPWQRKLPGQCIYHAPWVPHATRCGDELLLALYCWAGDVARPAELC